MSSFNLKKFRMKTAGWEQEQFGELVDKYHNLVQKSSYWLATIYDLERNLASLKENEEELRAKLEKVIAPERVGHISSNQTYFDRMVSVMERDISAAKQKDEVKEETGNLGEITPPDEI